jgi:hypothetical protein
MSTSDAFEMGKSFCVTRRVDPPLSMFLWANEKGVFEGGHITVVC